MTTLDKATQIDAPIVLREQIEADGSVSRVTVWLTGDGDESEEQIIVREDPIPLTWGGTLWHGYDKNGELVRLLVNNHDR